LIALGHPDLAEIVDSSVLADSSTGKGERDSQ
jgi:hypothetical protein